MFAGRAFTGAVSIPDPEQTVSDRPGAQRYPVGGDPVGERGQHGLAGVHIGQHKQPGQARLDETQTARGGRDHPDDAGRRVGHQDQRGARMAPGRPQRQQQAQVVERQAARGEQERLPPPPPERSPDLVTLREQGFVQPLQRGPFPPDPVRQPLPGPARPAERSIVGQGDRPERGEGHESRCAQERRMFQPPVNGRAEQDDRQGENREREQAAHAEKGERRQTAHGLACVHPAGRQHPELDRGPHCRPSRHDQGDRVAGQLGGDDREPRLGLQREALQCERAGEVGDLGADRRDEPPGVQGRQARPGREHFGDRREHEVDSDAGDDDHRGALEYRLPGQRMRLLLVDPRGQGRLARDS